MNFNVWAPNVTNLELLIDDSPHPMQPAAGGWWSPKDESLLPVNGQRYGYRIDGSEVAFPDPRTRRQPDGIHGLSQVYMDDFAWTDNAWQGLELRSMVMYELHVGTFSEEGTFEGVVDKLDYLAELGVNAIELMPVQPFGGKRGWGYDGVDWWAVHEEYGGPDGLKALVDAAHNKGIAVVLDVVYNHFGPDGNYTGAFAPYTVGGSTGWGEVVNISGADSDEVRRYILGSARQWLDEFHIDGLRLDAIHALDDRGAYSIMEQIQYVADEVAETTGFPRSIIAESDLNDPRLITAQADGGYGLAGQWVDDIHHGLHTLVSGEDHAYYSDYGDLTTFVDILRTGWLFKNTYSKFRKRTHGRALDLKKTPAWQLVTYTTTHDQTGNRARGDRPSQNLTPNQQVLKAAVIFCSPFTPMLFMGEEFGATTPFPFFCSHTNDELLIATREGRVREFARSGWDAADVPDPGAESTFDSAKLNWQFTDTQHEILEAYRTLLALRRSLVLPHPDLRQFTVEAGTEDDRWLITGSGAYRLVANLSGSSVTAPITGTPVYSFKATPEINDETTTLGPWEFVLLEVAK